MEEDYSVTCPLCPERESGEVQVIESIDVDDGGPLGNYCQQYLTIIDPQNQKFTALLYALFLCRCRLHPIHIFWIAVYQFHGRIYTKAIPANVGLVL
jgi:hypothetical protein